MANEGIELTIRQKIGELEPGEIRVIRGWSVWNLRNHSPAMYQLCRAANGRTTHHMLRLEQAVEFLRDAA